MGEVSIFDFRVVLNIAVATPQAPADNCAGIGAGAPALAISLRVLALWGQDTEVNLYCGGLDFSHMLIRCVFVLGTGAKLNRAIAVIALLHRETAEAVAVFAAIEVVPGDVTMMPMAHLVFFPLDSLERTCLRRSLCDSGGVYQQRLTVFAVKDLDDDFTPSSLGFFHQGLHFFGLTETAESILHAFARDVPRCPAWATKFEPNSRSFHALFLIRQTRQRLLPQ